MTMADTLPSQSLSILICKMRDGNKTYVLELRNFIDIKCPTLGRSLYQTGFWQETEFNSMGCNEETLMNYLEECGQH